MSKREVFGIGCIWVAVFAVILMIPIGVWGFRVATAELKGRGDAHIQIQSGANRIAQYDKFFNLCAGIQGHEGSIVALEEQIATTTDERTLNILKTNLTGLKSARQRDIAKYNSDALKNYTDGQFRDSDLPYQINSDGKETQCAYQ